MTTSARAFAALKASGKRHTLARMVYACLDEPRTAGEIHKIVEELRPGTQLNSISPRMAELRECGHISEASERVCFVTGIECVTWKRGGTPKKKKHRFHEAMSILFDAGQHEAVSILMGDKS